MDEPISKTFDEWITTDPRVQKWGTCFCIGSSYVRLSGWCRNSTRPSHRGFDCDVIFIRCETRMCYEFVYSILGPFIIARPSFWCLGQHLPDQPCIFTEVRADELRLKLWKWSKVHNIYCGESHWPELTTMLRRDDSVFGEHFTKTIFTYRRADWIIDEILDFVYGSKNVLKICADKRRFGLSTAIWKTLVELSDQVREYRLSIAVFSHSEVESDELKLQRAKYLPWTGHSIDFWPSHKIRDLQFIGTDLIMIDDYLFLDEFLINKCSKFCQVVLLQSGLSGFPKCNVFSTNDPVSSAAHARGSQRKWLLLYFHSALDLDYPILEAFFVFYQEAVYVETYGKVPERPMIETVNLMLEMVD